jgi:amino acid adenylation domain-containing protein
MNKPDRFPLTFTQQDIHLHQALQPSSALYNVGGYLRCGRLDVERVQRAHRDVVRSHDAFGIRVVTECDGAQQYVSGERTVDLPLRDFSSMADPQVEATAWVRGLFDEFLPHENSELFRAFLVKIGDESFWYVGIAHHLCMDGWGFANWAVDLQSRYSSLAGEEGCSQGSEESASWQDVAVADQRYADSIHYADDREFWLQQCGRLPGRLLPRRDAAQTGGPSSRRSVLELRSAQMDDLQRVADQLGLALPQLVLGILAAYFSVAYSKDKVVVGVPVHNRRNHLQKKMIGVFTSISPLVLELDRDDTLAVLLSRAGRIQRSAFRHQRYPLGHIVRDLGMSGRTGAIYDVSFNYLKLQEPLTFDGAPSELVYLSHNREETPVTFTLWTGAGGRSEIQIDYSTAHFHEEEIKLLSARIDYLLESAEANLQRPLRDIEVIPEEERRLLMVGFGSRARLDMSAQSLISLFRQQVQLNGGRIAVSCLEQQVSYADLDSRVDRLAMELLVFGAGPEAMLGICVERSFHMLVAALAVMKTGAAYVPLDPMLPVARLRHMVGDAGLSLVITQSGTSSLFAETAAVRCVELDSASTAAALQDGRASNVPVQPSDPSDGRAYLIYTSGSSGVPKGTVVGHRAIASHIRTVVDELSFKAGDVVLQLTSFAFDTFIEQTFCALVVGARVHVHADGLPDSREFFELVERTGATITDLPPAYLSQLLAGSDLADWRRCGLTRVVVGGEALSPDVVDSWFKRGGSECCQLYNAYGPTEAVITTTLHPVSEDDRRTVRIGRVIGERKLYVMNRDRRLCPLGVIGELYIGGSCLALGYLNQVELGHGCFINDPHDPTGSARMYSTGDLVRYLADGDLEFIGRMDGQVKLRGFRVELADVEHALLACSEVASCIVRLWEAETYDSRLVAYVKPRDNAPRDSSALSRSLRSHLGSLLPGYMVPSAFVVVEDWPLTLGGKIDRSALPAPLWNGSGEAFRAPTTAVELALAEIWAGLLRVEPGTVGAVDSFFDLGGHSLLAMRLRSEIRSRFNVEVSMKDIFERPFLETMAHLIDGLIIRDYVGEKLESATIVSEGVL